MEEMWKEVILLNEVYKISSFGIVVNPRTGNPLYVEIPASGYPSLSIKRNKKVKHFRLHRLLLMVFVRLPKEGEEGRHLDGNRLNYSLDNLKWGTKSEICQDAIKHKTRYQPDNKGSKSGNSKLSDEQALEIDSLISKGVRLGEIAKRFCVSLTTVWSIKTRKTYKYLWNKPTILKS